MDFFAFAGDPEKVGDTFARMGDLGRDEYRQRVFVGGKSGAPAADSQDVTHVLEILMLAMQRGSSLSKNLNILAYSHRAKENDRKNQHKVDQKTFYINNSEKSEDGEPLYDAFTQHTLPSHVLSTSEGGYEEVEMSSTTKAAVQWVLDNRRRLFLEHGVDVVRALSVMGENEDAQNNLRVVCYGNPEFREILDDIRKLSAVRCLNMSVTDLFKPHVNDPFLHERGLSRT